MNRKIFAVRKLKDGDDRYIWEPNDSGGASLLAMIIEIEDYSTSAPMRRRSLSAISRAAI